MFICIIFATVGIFCKLIITKYIVEFILVFPVGKKKSQNTICFKGLVLNLSLFPYKIRYFFLTNFKTKEETCDFFPRKSVAFTLRISGIFFFFFFPPLPGKCCNFSVKKNKTNKTLSFFFFNLRICYFFLANSSFFVNLFLVWYMNNWIPDKSQVIPSGYS